LGLSDELDDEGWLAAMLIEKCLVLEIRLADAPRAGQLSCCWYAHGTAGSSFGMRTRL
jgi:hypothetical protein